MSLPSGYKRLEYIQSNGTQYVDTEFQPNQNTRVDVVFQSSAGKDNSAVAGVDSGWLSSGFAIFLATFEFGSSSFNLLSPMDDGLKHIAVLNKGSSYVDGASVWTASGNFSSQYSMYLFSLNRSGTPTQTFIGNIYSCQIYDNGTLVRDFIPCQNVSGAIGLWDAANEVFYGNAGTGEFIAGPVVAPPDAPSGLRQTMAVRIAWNAVSGATGYKVYRDGALLGSLSELFFVDSTAEENMEYTYGVTAIGSGGEGEPATIVIYTRAGYFVYKPYVESATFQ